MSNSRKAAIAVLSFRIVYGAALIVAPMRTTKSWLGAAAQGGGSVPTRALGAREIALHAGGIAALLADEPVQPWLFASIAGDCADIASTFAASSDLPDGATGKTAVVAGASAAITAGVAAAL
jgi:hypothetical protein